MNSTERSLHMAIFFLAFIASTRGVINVATGRPTEQSTTKEQQFSSLAVDGNFSSCSHTESELESAWWKADLQTIYIVLSVHIKVPVNSQSRRRLAGYSVLISDAGNDANYRTCYDYGTPDALPDVTKVQIANCSKPLRGRYVMIYQSREHTRTPYPANYSRYALLELCDVQVFVHACQVATHKPAKQSSTLNKNLTANNAVDGSIGNKHMNNCSLTAGGKRTAWWRVNLEKLYLIQSIVIYPRPHNVTETQGRFAGFSLSVSDRENGIYHKCFDYGNFGPIPDVTVKHVVNCFPPKQGQYVKIENKRDNGPYATDYSKTAFVSLCEVEIIAQECFDTCIDCVCSACKEGFYGRNCNRTCSTFCGGNGLCRHENGRCNSQSCLPGYYGEQCDMKCHTSCIGNTCDFNNGYCFKCNESKYGINCSKSCPTNCRSCKSETICTECENGWYGSKCEKSCSNCGSDKCEEDTGRCQGDHCKLGYFTVYCNLTCSENCVGSCDFLSGECNKCNVGWKGKFCNIECGNNTFGESCSKTCGKCKDNLCHHVYGSCLQGCQDGWSSMLCNIDENITNPQAILVGAIGGSVGGALFVLLGVFAVVIIFRRRNRNDSTYMLPSNSPASADDRVYTSIQTQRGSPAIQQSEMDSIQGNYQNAVMENSEDSTYMSPCNPPASEDHVYTSIQTSSGAPEK